MKFQNYVTRTVKTACFFLAVMMSCLLLQQYVLRNVDHNSLRVEGFYQEERDSLDAVFIGASDIYTSFMPGRAYEKYGFTSYLLASESITSEGVITAVKEVVRTQHPSLIIIEANAFLYGDSDNETNEAHVHKFFDNLPFSINKLNYINRKVPVDNKWEYMFPLIKYHGLWTELPDRVNMMQSNFNLDLRGYNYLKGFRTTAKVFKSDTPSLNSQLPYETGELDLDPELQQNLFDLLDYSKENNLNVIFVRAPHYVTKDTYDRVKRSNKMESILEERGFDYYAFENYSELIGIDDSRDFYNEDHMNVYGAIKFTDFLAEGLANDDDLKIGEQSEAQQEMWKEVSATTNRLYRYCDDLMTNGEEKGAQEDVITLDALENYSDAPIER
ncbi:hypothetical protein [Lachnoclostridium sp. MSJ-17]|uniref:hypothetical protein n=1 Tax=Lachnoclostridium sp. MSJ-17 TaxID=2841516 RepID=UPI001C1122D8|nr:hypothetical protein [Lachnoclostridium sp. MSJ-17]MBU5461301.1 hypothetical protein [Lachnoclostridium sp. MSJ-17]